MKNAIHSLHFIVILLLSITLPRTINAQAISRIGNSPYPTTAIPDTLFIINLNSMTADQQFTVVTLQGILSKTKPRIMVERGSPQYLQDLLNYGITYDSTYENDFTGLMNHFKNDIGGYLLCNLSDSTTNAAISVCGFYNAVAATAADSAILDSLGLPLLYNLTNVGQTWAFDTFQTQYSKRIASYQDWGKQSYLTDYSIMSGAYTFWGLSGNFPPDNTTMASLLPNSAMIGWGSDEFQSVSVASQHGVMVHASDWANNISTYTNIPAPPLVQKNHSADTIIKPNTHTVCFVMTDGDNVQWLLGDFVSDPGTYGSQHRGRCNLGWTISPALAELAPTAMKYIYDTASTNPTGQDYFIAGPSGMGYFYPEQCPTLDSATSITGRMMNKAGLSIVNVIGNSFDRIYLQPYLEQSNIDAVFYYPFQDGYQGQGGEALCANGKPILTPRFSMWTGFYNAETLAQALDSMPKNPNSVNGYSLVDVHVFGGGTVDSVLQCISLLDSNIRVVTPDAFVKLFKQGVNCDTLAGVGFNNLSADNVTLHCQPNPANTQTKVTYTLPQTMQADIALYDMLGRKVINLTSGLQSAGDHSLDMDVSQLAAGMYFLNLHSPNISASQKLAVK